MQHCEYKDDVWLNVNVTGEPQTHANGLKRLQTLLFLTKIIAAWYAAHMPN